MNDHTQSNAGEHIATTRHSARRDWITGAALHRAITWPPELVTAAAVPPTLEQLVPHTQFAQVVLHPTPPWPAFNPSIATDDGGYAMIVRTANHRLVDGTRQILDDHGAPSKARVVRTRNYLVRLDAAFAAYDTREIHDHSGREVHATGSHGFEDCRLVRWRDEWWAIATVRDSHPSGMAAVMLLRLHDSGHEVHVIEATELATQQPRERESLLAPYTSDGALRLLQRWHPLQEMEWNGSALPAQDQEDGQAGTALHSEWRCSSQGAQVDGGWLFVVQEVCPGAVGHQYLHRFVRLADDGTTRWSPQFTFTGTPVECAAGLAVRDDEVVVVSFGVNDALAALAVVPLAGVLDSLG